jgi:outer membrane lipoprotein-sorting protein
MSSTARLLSRAALTAVLALHVASAFAQTADEVIEKHIAALGGQAALAKLTSRTVSGAITLTTPAGDVSGTISVFSKAPNKARTVIKVDLSSFGAGELVVDQRFDGTTGYVLDSLNGNRDITGNQLENLKNATFPTPLLTYKDAGVKAELLGKEKVGDRDAYVVQLTPKAGSSSKQYFDATSYMILKAVTMVNVPQLGRDIEQTVEFSDYRPVDGVQLPFGLTASSAVQNYTVAVGRIEHNASIDDASFVKPQ